MKNLFKKPIFWVVVLLIAITALFLFSDGDRFFEERRTAVRVNSEVSNFKEFNSVAGQVQWELSMLGQEATKETVKDQATERLIYSMLLREYAKKKGVDATKEEIDREFAKAMEDYGIEDESEFIEQLNEYGIETREDFERLLALEIKMEKLAKELFEENEEMTETEAMHAVFLKLEELKEEADIDIIIQAEDVLLESDM